MTGLLAEKASDGFYRAVLEWTWWAGGSPWGFYLVALAGAAAILLLVPRPAGRPRRSGLAMLLGSAALAGLVVLFAGMRWHRSNWVPREDSRGVPLPLADVFGAVLAPSPAEPWFYLFALIAVCSAVKSMLDPRPIYCVLYFVLTVLAVGAVLLLTSAGFLAVALIVIYAGAILVLYVFVIMLARGAGTAADGGAAVGRAGSGPGTLGPDSPIADPDARTRSPLAALMLSLLLVCGLGTVLAHWASHADPIMELARRKQGTPPAGTTASLGVELFRHHLLALELAGVLLLMAVVAAIALVRRRVVPVEPPGGKPD